MKAIADLRVYRSAALHLYGGTMDPVHRGHIEVARAAVRQMGWDNLVLMVAGTPPHKRDRAITDVRHRLMMTRLAVEPYDELLVSSWEAERKEYAYTADTLKLLREEFGIREIDFLIGADSLMMLENWYHPADILSRARIVAAGRPEQVGRAELERQAAHIRETYGADVVLLPVEGPDISATELRRKLTLGLDVEEEIPRTVLDYIQKEHLYTGGR